MHRAITRILVFASVLGMVLGANPGAAAPAPSPGFAVFEWYKVSQVNARVSEQRLDSLRTDDFKTVYADVGEYLEVADQPASRTQRTRLNQLRSDLKRFVARASNLGFAVHAVAGGPNWTDATHRYLGPKLVELVADYNGAVAPNERLQGVQLDIEPYVDPSFFDDVETSLQEYLSTLQSTVDTYEQVRTQAGNSGLRLGFAIPFWFDGVPEAPPVEFGPEHKTAPAAFHLIDMLRARSQRPTSWSWPTATSPRAPTGPSSMSAASSTMRARPARRAGSWSARSSVRCIPRSSASGGRAVPRSGRRPRRSPRPTASVRSSAACRSMT